MRQLTDEIKTRIREEAIKHLSSGQVALFVPSEEAIKERVKNLELRYKNESYFLPEELS